MKKVLLLVLLVMLVLLCACRDAADIGSAEAVKFRSDGIASFYYNEGFFGVQSEYSVNKDTLMLNMVLRDFQSTEEIPIDRQWDEQTWSAFTADLAACGIDQWDPEYMTPDKLEDYYWYLEITGDFGTITVQGEDRYPANFHQFTDMIDQYFVLPFDIWGNSTPTADIWGDSTPAATEETMASRAPQDAE